MHPSSSVQLVHLRRQDLQATATAHRAGRAPRSLAVADEAGTARPTAGLAARWRARLRVGRPGAAHAPRPLATRASSC